MPFRLLANDFLVFALWTFGISILISATTASSFWLALSCNDVYFVSDSFLYFVLLSSLYFEVAVKQHVRNWHWHDIFPFLPCAGPALSDRSFLSMHMNRFSSRRDPIVCTPTFTSAALLKKEQVSWTLTNAPLTMHASGVDIFCGLRYQSGRCQFPSLAKDRPVVPLVRSSDPLFSEPELHYKLLMWLLDARGCNYLLSGWGGHFVQ